MNKRCPICYGLGWVCENHPDTLWDKDAGCECGAGMPCECNTVGLSGTEEPDVSQVIVQGLERTKH